MEGDWLAEHSGVVLSDQRLLTRLFWRYEPCFGALQSALDPPPQREIVFCGSPLPSPNSSFTSLLPACTETRLSEIPSAKPPPVPCCQWARAFL